MILVLPKHSNTLVSVKTPIICKQSTEKTLDKKPHQNKTHESIL